ncbi:glycosyltransferase [Curtobacterium sp. ISL-83]|uniref:glycosyltransferase n=1 Tax=Curtobacterium sp. ISL-83 TaxID=2819145 RepID=UPI0027DF48EE|nr:glycosyltransferase [Curtobacterium sp. ISL-83]
MVAKVLQVNVRLSEGGASGVARTLHDSLPTHGFESAMAYGYGPSGAASPLEDEYDALRLTSRPAAAVNMIAHRMRGEEVVAPGRARLAALREAIRSADIVHLHAVHSYMMPPTGLMKMLAAEAKPVVWTMHDQWLMTGRCAQPGACDGWKTGCDPCPHLEAYPPATLDRAAVQFTRRRQAFEDLGLASDARVVACAEWLAGEMRTAGFRDVRVITNAVDGAFWDAVQSSPKEERDDVEPRYLFMSRDLRDPVKVDLPMLRTLAGKVPGRVTVVGDRLAEPIVGALHLPAVQDRSEMVRIMRDHSHLLFFSKVDYYPLTIAEALTAGLRVIASPSPAAREFEADERVRVLVADDEWEGVLDQPSEPTTADTLPDTLFDPQRMTAEYASLYREMLP